LLSYREEAIEQCVAEIDHLCNAIGADELIKQRYLASSILDAGRRRISGQAIDERKFVRIDIERRNRPPLPTEILDQHAGHQGLAYSRPRRGDDKNGRPVSH